MQPGRCEGESRWVRVDQDVAMYPSISGLVAEYILAINVTRVRFPADAHLMLNCEEQHVTGKTTRTATKSTCFGFGAWLLTLGVLSPVAVAQIYARPRPLRCGPPNKKNGGGDVCDLWACGGRGGLGPPRGVKAHLPKPSASVIFRGSRGLGGHWPP